MPIFSLSKISLADLDKLTDHLNHLVQELEDSPHRKQSIQEISHISHKITEYIKELYQDSSKSEIKQLIKEIRKGKPLSQEALNLLESVLIGDALSYLQAETNYAEWLNNLTSFTESIKNIDPETTNSKDLLGIYGRSVVLKRILQDLNFYYGQKERLQLFEENVRDGIDPEEAKHIITALKYKL